MKRIAAMAVAAALAAGGTAFNAAVAQQKDEMKKGKAMSSDAKRGRYLVQITGCNDCHTPGYAPMESKVDEKLWLTGDILGWRGPWGTTYPANLRLLASQISEDEWVKRATSPLRPPMPWFNVRDMTRSDVRAIYRYLKYMGPAGQPAPAYVPPDKTPSGPFVQFPAPPPGGKPPAKK